MQARSAQTVKLGPVGALRSTPALPPSVRPLASRPLVLLATALLALALLAAAAHDRLPAPRTPAAAPSQAHRLSRAGLLTLPASARMAVSATLGAEDPAYRVARPHRLLTASNPAQRLQASFARSGLTLRADATTLSLDLLAVGYGSKLVSLPRGTPSARANRVIYKRAHLEEWYANGPLGLEQGFTIAHPPRVHAAGPLTLSLLLAANAQPSISKDRQRLLLTRAGKPVLRYTGLRATDARGRTLRTWLQLKNRRLLLRVDATGARYPLRIDPLIQQGEKLTGTGAVGTGRLGYSVALSADGNTALVGAHYQSPDAGGAWVFTRSGETWTQQGPKLIGVGHAGAGEFAHVSEGEFGRSVALSADGNTALVGAPTDNNGIGAAWMFTRSGSTWTQQGAKLAGGEETGEGRFATSVTLSADGATALIGGPADNGNVGAAWAFTRTGSTWTQQGAKLAGGEETGEGRFATSVALSEHGDTALIGGPADNGHAGAAWAFTRTGSTWTQQGEKLTATGETGEGELGQSVALSADGNTGLIGAPSDNSNVGAAFAFIRTSSVWTQQGAKLTATGETGEGKLGQSVALSADGNTGLIGAPGDNANTGAAFAFTRTGPLWTQQGAKLTATGETGEGKLGASVALSADGNTALTGAPEDDAATGAAWALTRSGETWAQQGAKLTGTQEANPEFGVLVALSADGNTALIGGWNDNGTKGAAWVFTRSGETWSQEGPKLTPTGETGRGGFGTSVALSADGNTALIGAPGDNGNAGAAWVFTRTGTTWTQQGGKLTGAGETGAAWFGYTVALSGDGSTALVGGWLDTGWKGASWVFARTGETWSQQGAKLTPNDETGEGMFATNVALSANGNTALIGGWNDDNIAPGYRDYSGRGAAWVFTRSGETWSQQGPKLTASDETGEGRFGVSAALSADGNTALIGGLDDNGTRGAAWLFTRSGSTWTQQGAKLIPSDESGEGEFGTNVALSADGSTALIGGWRDNGGTGAAWAFTAQAEQARTPPSEPGTTPPGQTSTVPTASPPPPGKALPSPAIENARQSANRWREGNRLARIARAKTPIGTTFSFTLNERATVTFTFTRRSPGRKLTGHCVAQTTKNRHKAACVRTTTAGILTFPSHAGTDKVAFQGRLSPTRRLKPGSYTLLIAATDSAGRHATPRSLTFTILK